MLFTSLHFIIFFLVVLLSVCIIEKRKYQHLLLLFASFYFYWVSSHLLIFLLLIATLISYYCGDRIYRSTDKNNKRVYLTFAVIALLGILGYFKYYNFGISAVNTSLAFLFNLRGPLVYLDIILPIGISFYTFQALSYVFDIYRNRMEPTASLREYALFVAFFPQLVAGPIVRAIEFLPQLKRKVILTPENLRYGMTLMAWGFFKKITIADNLAPTINATFSNPIGASSLQVVFATFLFGIQIFCDFSGYTDIALGTARIMNFSLPINFNRPYLSHSPTEFWRKWHMTLSRFVRDYLYIPLGGNRKGVLRTHINLIVTWIVCGLWHGASWNFLIWGGYHGILLSAHKIISPRLTGEEHDLTNTKKRIILVLSVLITQYFVFLGWLIFRVSNFENLKYCLFKFLFFDFRLTTNQQIEQITVLVVLLACIVFFFTAFNKKLFTTLWNTLHFDHIGYLNKVRLSLWILFMVAIIIAITIMGPNASPQFIYFQF